MKVSSTDVQNNFGKYLKFVQSSEEVIITKNGKDIAKIVPCQDENGQLAKEGAAAYRSGEDWVTYEEFIELTENSDERYELIDGVVYNLASPSYKHQHAVGELYGTFYNWFKGKSCMPLTSPFDITLVKAEDNICVVQPDIVVICDTGNRDHRDRYKGVPALVVEVLSPSTRSKDLTVKLQLYMHSGVQECWFVDPYNEHVNVYRFENGEIVNHAAYTRIGGAQAASLFFDGLAIATEDLFE